MDQGEANKMTPNASYPSPTAQHHGLPFYSQQPSAERENHSHPQAPTAPMQAPDTDNGSYPNLVQAQISSPQQFAQQVAQQGLELNQTTPQGDSDSNRKKQKVSRACDECRRKKIKCDAVEGDTSKVSCSACVRSETQCQFSRAPQKRGPSKGYIKELAERVHQLETQTNNPYQSSGGFPPDVGAYSPSEFMASESRKRTHSISDGTHTFGPDVDQLQQFGKAFTPNMTSSAVPLPAGAFAFPGGLDPLRNINSEMDTLTMGPIDEYYRELHTYLPVLPDSRTELDSTLESVRKPVKDAVMASIHAVMQLLSGNLDPKPLDVASKLLAHLLEEDVMERSNVENLLVLQATLFAVISKEVGGPGKNVTVLAYGNAYTIATHLDLHLNEEVDPNDSREVASFKSNGRRSWLILTMLDRWHAASIVKPILITDESLRLRPSDRKLLGENAFHLNRLSMALGHIAMTIIPPRPQLNLDDEMNLLLARSIRGEIDRFGEGVELSFPVLRHVHLAFLHTKLLADRQLGVTGSNTKAVMAGALQIITLLSTDQNHASPFTHHFAALAAITLAEVMEHNPGPITSALKDLQNALDNGATQHPFGTASNRPAWSIAISKFVASRLDLQSQKTPGTQLDGLQHLADAAVGADGGHADDEGGKALDNKAVDWTAMTRAGYLRLFE